ncbi:MAG: aminotransferase class I/II-fold pyridoxal phosphate-dependent enzyme, partial [Desulfobacterales bacterium]
VPSILTDYPDSIVATSFSKDLSIPGERIGFIAVNPQAAYYQDLMAGLNLANRSLGFINAPALMQRVVSQVAGQTVDVNAYAHKRELICDILAQAGFDFVKPPGTFYVFPKSPLEDDLQFVDLLQAELILAVPGVAFGAPGYFRLVFCVEDEVIQKSRGGFIRVMERV